MVSVVSIYETANYATVVYTAKQCTTELFYGTSEITLPAEKGDYFPALLVSLQFHYTVPTAYHAEIGIVLTE